MRWSPSRLWGYILNLTTHFFFSLAVGFVFFGQPAIAFVMALGALLPDLDREYWFIPQNQYRDEQLHRSLFHNVFVMGAVFLFSPIIALGMFLHVFQDSFTTIKDRGCEWLYPITRLVKRGREDEHGKDEELDPKERVYFYQEDPKGLLEKADPDLREVGERPVPWRRCYGPALNGQLLDQGFLIGSIVVIAVWMILPNGANLGLLRTFFAGNWMLFILGFAAIALLFTAGELDRRNEVNPFKVPALDLLKFPLFAAGLALAGVSVFLERAQIAKNLSIVSNNWLAAVVAVVVVSVASLVIIKVHTRAGKIATV